MSDTIMKKIFPYLGWFFAFFMVYHWIGCEVFPSDGNNYLIAPYWYAPVGILISAVLSYITKNILRRRDQNKLEQSLAEMDESIEEMEESLAEMRHDRDNIERSIVESRKQVKIAQHYADVMNTTTNPKEFSAAYNHVMTALRSLMRFYDEGIVTFSSDPQEDILTIDKNMPLSISKFMERSFSSIPSTDPKWAAKTINLISEMHEDIVFESFWTESHQMKVDEVKLDVLSANRPENILDKVDRMDGHEFEFWCAELLRNNGFQDVDVTPASGDHGVDVLAEKEGIHYAIQCKCYSKDIGNTPIQEVYAGKEMYRCQVGVVMTNRHFTKGAKELAEKTRVLLWDRDKIRQMIELGK